MANIDPLAALSSEEMRRLIEERKRQQSAERARLAASFAGEFSDSMKPSAYRGPRIDYNTSAAGEFEGISDPNYAAKIQQAKAAGVNPDISHLTPQAASMLERRPVVKDSFADNPALKGKAWRSQKAVYTPRSYSADWANPFMLERDYGEFGESRVAPDPGSTGFRKTGPFDPDPKTIDVSSQEPDSWKMGGLTMSAEENPWPVDGGDPTTRLDAIGAGIEAGKSRLADTIQAASQKSQSDVSHIGDVIAIVQEHGEGALKDITQAQLLRIQKEGEARLGNSAGALQMIQAKQNDFLVKQNIYIALAKSLAERGIDASQWMSEEDQRQINIEQEFLSRDEARMLLRKDLEANGAANINDVLDYYDLATSITEMVPTLFIAALSRNPMIAGGVMGAGIGLGEKGRLVAGVGRVEPIIEDYTQEGVEAARGEFLGATPVEFQKEMLEPDVRVRPLGTGDAADAALEAAVTEMVGEMGTLGLLARGGVSVPNFLKNVSPAAWNGFARIGAKIGLSIGAGGLTEASGETITAFAQLYTALKPEERQVFQNLLSQNRFDDAVDFIVQANGGLGKTRSALIHSAELGGMAGIVMVGGMVIPQEIIKGYKNESAAFQAARSAYLKQAAGLVINQEEQAAIDEIAAYTQAQIEEFLGVEAPNVEIRNVIEIDKEGNLNQGHYNKKTKKIVINLGSILEGHHGSQGILSPGANMGKVKSEINTVIAHEGGHLGIAKRARQVGEKNFITNIFNNNRKEILAWLNEPGNPYKSMYPDVTTNREQLGNATEEWLNSLTENDWKTKNKIANRIRNLAGKVLGSSFAKRTDIKNLMAEIRAESAQTVESLADIEAAADNVVPITRESATAEETIPELAQAASLKPSPSGRVPQTWQALETSELRSVMEANRAKDNPIWQAQYRELENRAAAEVAPTETVTEPVVTTPVPANLKDITPQERVDLETAAEASDLQTSVDNILSTFDSDATATEAIDEGNMDQIVRMEAQDSNFTREELWKALNERIDAGAEQGIVYSKKSRKDQTPEEKITGDVNDRSAKVFRPAIAALQIDPVERQAREELHKRLQKLFGAPARKRGVQAGNLQVYQKYAQEIVDGNLDVVSDFIAKFEPKLTGKAEKVRKAATRRAQRAKRLDKTDAEVMKYRPKGTRHPMEPKMSYPFARSEIDALEKAGDITAEEAEARRQGVNRIRRVFAGKAGQTVKRILAEMTYGIGNYTDIVPWSEVYTEAEIAEKGERAEVGVAQARIERYDPTSLTTKEKMALLKKPETAEEKAWLDGDNMRELGSRRERLAFLRAPAEFKSPSELAEFKAWQKDQRGFKQAEYKEKQAAERAAQVKAAEEAGKVTRIPSKEGPFTPADARRMWTDKSNITNYDPTWFDRLKDDNLTEDDTTFTVAGQERTVQGEVVDLDSMSVDDDVVFSKVKNPSNSVARAATLAKQGQGMSTPAWYKNQEAVAFKAYPYDDMLTHSSGSVMSNKLNYIVTNNGEIHQVDQKTFDRAINPAAKKKVSQKLVNWKSVVSSVTGKDTLRGATLEQKIEAVYKWAKKYNTNPPDSIKRGLYESIWGEPTRLGSAVAEMNAHTRGRYWSREHALEMDEVATPQRIIKLYEETLSDLERTQFFRVFSEENYTMMPQFLNKYKQGLNNISSWEELVEAQSVLDDWYKEVGKQLANNDTGFLEAHQNALKAFLDMHGDKFPTQTLPDFKPVDFGSSGAAINELYTGGNREQYIGALFGPPQERADVLFNDVTLAMEAVDAVNNTLHRKKKRGGKKGYTEHFNDSFWYKLTSFLYGKPVQAIRDVNKNTRFGTAKGTITAADQIADLIQRHHSSAQRAEGLEGGTDLVQDVSLRTGEFYSALSKIFAAATNRKGVIEPAENAQLVDFLAGKDVSFSNPEIEQAATELKSLLGDIYAYAQQETKGLKEPLDLRGAGDTLIPRVWNIEWLATREGKAQFLKEISDKFSPPGSTTPIFEDADITVDDLYDVVINSGGFVQGEWTNIKADQTRTEKDIEKDLKVQEYLDMLNTSDLIDLGLVLDDMQAVVPRFIQKAVERVEYAKRFGKNDEILREMIKQGLDQIRAHNREALKLKKDEDPIPYIDEKKFEKSVWDMSRILRNKYGYDMANMPTRIWLQRLTNAATIAKLPLVALASMPEFFTPMLKGDVSPHHWFVDLMAATSWAGYKGMSGMSKLLFNKHLPAMRKYSSEIEGLGIISDIQLLRELGIADIQAMGDLVSTRYANPNFARGGLRAGAKGTLAAKIPKGVRATFNMQTYMQATMLTTMTEMQQLMALRNFQRHVSTRLKFISENKGKTLTDRKANKLKQYKQDLMDYGITTDIDLDTSSGLAEFNAGALRFIDQVITRPNDATTAKAFKNPLVAPLVLFKRFITTFGNTLITSVGNDFANKVDNVERAKQVGKVATTAMAMYGAVMFAEIMRGAIKGDLDEDDFTLTGGDFNQFMRRLDRTGLLTAPGALAVNLAFPYKRGWWDSTESRIMGELTGPLGGDLTAAGDAILKNDLRGWHRLMGQLVPTLKHVVPKPAKKKRKTKKKKKKGPAGGLY